jgi:hypothetical protein
MVLYVILNYIPKNYEAPMLDFGSPPQFDITTQFPFPLELTKYTINIVVPSWNPNHGEISMNM